MTPSRTSPLPISHMHTVSPGLTPDQLARFNKDGYLLIPDALTPEAVASLLAETHDLLDNFPLESHPMTKFTTGETDAHVGDDYFLDSGDKIRFFFEEDAFSATGELLKPKAKAINKIGHYLHVLSPPFAKLLEGGDVQSGKPRHNPGAIARSLGFIEPECLQSMVICKQPEIGGAVPPHQDSTFLYTDPPSAVGFWYALEDATKENGCLSFLKGSHRWAANKRRMVRKAAGNGTEFVNCDGAQFPDGEGYGVKFAPEDGEDGEYELGEVKAGTLVLIHGNLLHKSEKNLSAKGRIIYTFHVIEGHDAVYDERNWLRKPKGGFTRL